MDGVCDDDLCWLHIEDFRMLLVKTIEPSRITPYLRQCQVISAEDEEQLFNDPTLVIRRRKVGALLDMLQMTGEKGHTAFLESLELDYPQVYSRITGKEPNRTFSILIDTAGESGLTQFLMSELGRLQRALQDERKRRQQACSVAKEQEAFSRQQKLKERELKKLSERVQKIREERQRLCEELKQLRDHNYSLMADINTLNQEKSAAQLANRDLQIEVERLKHTLLRAENQTRLLRRRTMRSLQQSRNMAPPPDTSFHMPEEQKEEKPKEMPNLQKSPTLPPMNLLANVFRLKRELHTAEEQKARSLEEKEELELHCVQLKGDAKMFQQQNKQTLRQLDEVIKERDKALAWQAQLQEEVRLLLQEKDQHREGVRQLSEKSDRLELQLLRSQGEELQLRTRLRKMTFNSSQCEKSVTSEDEDPTTSATKGSSEEVHSGMSGENKELHSGMSGETEDVHSGMSGETEEVACPVGGVSESEHGPPSWEEQSDSSFAPEGRQNFFYRRKRALRSKFTNVGSGASNLDDSSGSDITESD
ncbi:caspase recruitment domain-containing protein 9 [Cololabis saira]|uniref:caspase recruitment domain-containing protein 9 n=1 Tax=Cololabis saira TaxID=129043 RepID=UPI002AD2C974|nr:caspase recruitment domain-containing protein 9 [Cololabis saira]XP_061586151.1 caspase recruitment domain-containing protein 9 [Cololabis saira]XP_061586152.1 caspase recruitment domain-containing protein 9 [Cololabis saira]